MNRQQSFLLLLLVIAAVASFWVLLPFIEWVLGALILGYVLRPLHCRLEPHLGKRLAAATSITVAAIAILLPLVYIGYVVYRDVQDLATGESDLALEKVEEDVQRFTGQDVELAGATGDLGSLVMDFFFGSAPEIASYLTTVLLGIAVVLFLVYYVLIDGPDFVQWAVNTAPLDDAVAHEILSKMDEMTWGVVAGHIFVAIVQGVVGGFAFWVAGLPSAAFWSVVMVVLSLLPVIGAPLVWAPAAAYLYMVGDTVEAVFVFLWGLIIVSLIDDYLRSIVIDQSADVNPGVILVGVVGGVYTLGGVGLFVGPIVIGMLAAMIRAFDEHYDELATDTPPPAPPDDGRLSWLDTHPAAEADDLDGHADPDEYED